LPTLTEEEQTAGIRCAVSPIENKFGSATRIRRAQAAKFFKCELAGDENEMVLG
jgi:hypothetical protein